MAILYLSLAGVVTKSQESVELSLNVLQAFRCEPGDHHCLLDLFYSLSFIVRTGLMCLLLLRLNGRSSLKRLEVSLRLMLGAEEGIRYRLVGGLGVDSREKRTSHRLHIDRLGSRGSGGDQRRGQRLAFQYLILRDQLYARTDRGDLLVKTDGCVEQA